MADEYQAYIINSSQGDPTGGYGGMPPDVIDPNDPLGGGMPPVNPPDAVDPNDPLGGGMPPVNPPDAVDPNDPLGGGTPPGEQPRPTPTPQIPTDLKNFLRGLIVGDDGKPNPMGLLGIMGLLSMMRGSGAQAPVGYQGGIPKYSAVRERVPIEADPNRRPGSGGRRYFSDTTYVPQDRAATAADANAAAKAAAVTAARTQAAGLKQAPYTAPVIAKPDEKTVGLGSLTTAPKSIGGGSKVTELLKLPQYNDKGEVISVAQGGLMNLAKGRYLNGATDGMADKIPANIDGQQPAALSHGEFVIPADVVSHLGNGNSESGAQRLYDMMDRIRKARTGSTKQGKQINPDKFLPR